MSASLAQFPFDLHTASLCHNHSVKLCHVHCAKFCVLGGGSCS